ncbi:MAG: hypothetical protein CMO73_04195 [Verrucomicrobiales bacterium]|jgi:DNA repair exonuclease SbcCD ATPase subunit|nr:hypothetical protein [Verrucomicrobiales bacterium]HAA88075.1 hypothetical protein [Verrucomicrobiales bacterium]
MQIKYFLIPSALFLAISCVLSWMHRTELIEKRTERTNNNKQIVQILGQINKKDQPELLETYGKLLEQEQRRDQSKANTDQLNINIKALDGEITGLKAAKAPLDKKLATAENVVTELRKKLGPDVTLQNIAPTIKKLENDLENAKQDLATRQAELEVVSKKVAANEVRIQKAETVQAERLVKIERNATEGVVTAVNKDWGFVLVNIGKDQGVEGDSELIVKRDGIRIGNLSVVSIQPGLTVADISQKGLSKAVEPGDKVVFQKLGE